MGLRGELLWARRTVGQLGKVHGYGEQFLFMLIARSRVQALELGSGPCTREGERQGRETNQPTYMKFQTLFQKYTQQTLGHMSKTQAPWPRPPRPKLLATPTPGHTSSSSATPTGFQLNLAQPHPLQDPSRIQNPNKRPLPRARSLDFQAILPRAMSQALNALGFKDHGCPHKAHTHETSLCQFPEWAQPIHL